MYKYHGTHVMSKRKSTRKKRQAHCHVPHLFNVLKKRKINEPMIKANTLEKGEK